MIRKSFGYVVVIAVTLLVSQLFNGFVEAGTNSINRRQKSRKDTKVLSQVSTSQKEMLRLIKRNNVLLEDISRRL